jgi:hypothetical protein
VLYASGGGGRKVIGSLSVAADCKAALHMQRGVVAEGSCIIEDT